jgi:adenylate cyclase class 2
MTGATETEVKLKVRNGGEIIGKLEAAGYEETHPRTFESNTIYDTANAQLFRQGMLIRLREFGNRGVLTWKGPPIPGPHKSRPELETSVGSLAALAAILSNLGYAPVFRYEKFRTEFKRRGSDGTVVLDETPIGTFLELEGDGDWIDCTAATLGFSRDNYVLDSYARLYRKECELSGMEPEHMVFPSSEE